MDYLALILGGALFALGSSVLAALLYFWILDGLESLGIGKTNKVGGRGD